MVKVNLGWRKFVTEFQGGEVSMELRPLKTASLLDITDLFEGAGLGKTALVGQLKMQEALGAIVGDHVRNLSGLEDEDGEPVTVNDLSDESVLLGLAITTLSELMSISHLLGGDSKNSSAPAGSTGKTGAETVSE